MNNFSVELEDFIKNRKRLEIKAGDTIIIPYGDEITKFVVLGVNENCSPYEEINYNFIDIMSKELLLGKAAWKKYKVYPGCYRDEIEDFEYLNYTKSDIIKELNSKLELFPREIQDIAVSKKERFLTGVNVLTNESIYTTIDIGKIWIPSVKEVTGNCYKSDADPKSNQYSYFNDIGNRRLGNWWWTCSARAFCDCHAYCINSNGGHSYRYAANSGCGSPLCLRIKLN